MFALTVMCILSSCKYIFAVCMPSCYSVSSIWTGVQVIVGFYVNLIWHRY